MVWQVKVSVLIKSYGPTSVPEQRKSRRSCVRRFPLWTGRVGVPSLGVSRNVVHGTPRPRTGRGTLTYCSCGPGSVGEKVERVPVP